jgi:nicotinate-nucleotide adenylyltransferase
MNIGVLGGTFDPPHSSHRIAALSVLTAHLADEVWMIPCLRHRFGKAPAPFEDRLAMCRLLVEDDSRIRVSDIEASINRPGYTIDLVQRLIADFPEHSFRLIAGADIYHQRSQWYHYDEVAALAPPIYIARKGVPPIQEPTLPAPPEISSSDLRTALSRGDSPVEAIPKTVLDYIRAHGLYHTDL